MLLSRDRFRQRDPISALFDGGVAGGYYPIRPGVNLWQDVAKTIPAVNLGDPVRVVAKVAGTLDDLIASSDAKRPVLASQDGKNMLLYDGADDAFSITFTPISRWSLYFRVKATSFLDNYEMYFHALSAAGGHYVFCGQNISSDNDALFLIGSGLFNGATTNFLANNILGFRTFETVNAYDYRVNGSVAVSGNYPSLTETREFFIGLSAFGVWPWHGYIGDTIFIDRNDETAITVIEANL